MAAAGMKRWLFNHTSYDLYNFGPTLKNSLSTVDPSRVAFAKVQ